MIGFHGCDLGVRDELILRPNVVKKSQEVFDWLGNGFYIWENNQERALHWAQDKQKRGKIKTASVVGVIYQLDHCLDFTDSAYTNLLAMYYDPMIKDLAIAGKKIPKNEDVAQDVHKDKVLRELDCAVIEYMHEQIDKKIKQNIAKNKFSPLKEFDTARGIFTEGGPAYEGAGIQLKNHIQICIRNLNCIKGFFIPRDKI
jgi:hypothetical protein